MGEPVRIRLSRAKGWRLPENTVVVSRPTKWGNPFIVGQDGTRKECTDLYALLLRGYISLGCKASVEDQRAARDYVSRNLFRLKGKNLACWCALPAPGERDDCHAGVLLSATKQPRPTPPSESPS